MTDWQVLFYLASIRFWRASPCARARAVYELPRPPSGHALLRLTLVKQRFNPHLPVPYRLHTTIVTVVRMRRTLITAVGYRYFHTMIIDSTVLDYLCCDKKSHVKTRHVY